MNEIKPGMFVVAWHPMLYRPAIPKNVFTVIAVGKRVKVESPNGNTFLLKKEDILAALDNESAAIALTLKLHEIGEDHTKRERAMAAETIQRIKNMVKEATNG